MSSDPGSEELRGLARSIHGLFAREFPRPAEVEMGEGHPYPGGEMAWVAESGVRLPGDEEGPDPLTEALDAFRNADPSQRPGTLPRLREAAEDARDRRAALVMAHAAESLVRLPEADPEVVDIARRLVTPGVATLLVARVTGAGNEDAGARELAERLPQLGGEVEEAVLEALRQEAPDPDAPRSARHALLGLVDGCAAQGSDILERMMEEPDWRIVRNAIHLVGDRGDPAVVQHLTVALGHSDGRVRKEALKALSKLGGEDASALAVGQLEDPDPAVRGQAARTAGLLRAERGLKPLLAQVEREDDPEVLVEVIRALGLLGDPSAVIPLEKHAVSGFFSRTPQVIRVAAYRALSAIGTPHAMALLRDALEDRDPEVRRTAEALLQAGS